MNLFRKKEHFTPQERVKIKNFSNFYPLFAFFLSIVSYCLSLTYLKVIGYGNNTILQSDLAGQYISFLEMFKRLLQGNDSFWYTFSEYLGSGAILTYAYYTLNPFNLLLLIPGANPATIIMIIIILKVGLIGYTMEYFLQKGLNLSSPYTILFSLCFALNGFVATLSYNLMWLDAIFMTPIIVYLIMRFVKTGKWFSLVPAYAYLFITNFYMGFIVGIFSGILFLFYCVYVRDNKAAAKKQLHYIFNKSILFLFSVMLAAGICSAILIPCAKFLFSHMADDNISFKELNVNFPELINSLFIGQSGTLDNTLPFLYSGLPVLILLPFYFLNRKRSLKEKLYVCGLLSVYILSLIILPLYKFMHAFDYPNFYAFRFSFLILFILVCMAAKELDSSMSLPTKQLFICVAILLFLYSALIPLKNIIRNETPVNTNYLLCLNALFLFLWAILLSPTKKAIKPKLHIMLTFALIIGELSINGYLCSFKGENLITELEYNSWIHDEGDLVRSIAPSNNEFYRIQIAHDHIFNSSVLFDVASFNTFSSSDDYTLRRQLNKLGYTVSNRCLESSGATPITEMLFGVRYKVTVPEDLGKPEATDSSYYVENPYALSLGYMVSPLIMNYIATDNPFVNQTNLIYAFTGKNYILYEVPEDMIEYGENIEVLQVNDSYVFHRIASNVPEGGYYYIVPHYDGKSFMAVFPTETPTYKNESPELGGETTGVNGPQQLSCGGIITGKVIGNENDKEMIGVFFDEVTTDYVYDKVYFSYFVNNCLINIYNDLSQNQLTITSFSDDRIEGNVSTSANRPVLFLSIPYDDSWTVTVDGIPSTVYKAVEDAFCCVVIPEEGEHHIVLEYKAAGAETGQLISIVSLSIYILIILYNVVTHKKKKQKSK